MKKQVSIVSVLILGALLLKAGEPIQFSQPRRSVKTPTVDPVEERLNKPLEKFNPGNSLGDPVVPSFSLPQPTIIIPKKNNREEDINNPFFNGDVNNLNSLDSQDLQNWDASIRSSGKKNLSPAEQFLLRQERTSLINRQKQQTLEKQSNSLPPNNNAQDKPRTLNDFMKENVSGFNKSPFYTGSKMPNSVSYDGLPGHVGLDSSIKTLMELRDKEMAEKQNKEKMEAFRRLLGDLPSSSVDSSMARGLLNSDQDLTRKNDNPIATMPNERMNFIDRKNSRLTFEDSKNMRSRLSIPNDGVNSSYQQNRFLQPDSQSDSVTDREKQKPRPLMNPIPRRPF